MARRSTLRQRNAGDLITLSRLQNFTPGARLGLLKTIVDNLATLDKYEINTPLRVAHFLAQCAVETAYYTTLFQKGTSARYKGRGYIQLTGQANYKFYGQKVGIDLVNDPDRAADPDLAVLLACLFWSENRLNGFADQDNARKVSRAINRGNANSGSPANNEAERIQYTTSAKTIFVAGADDGAFAAEAFASLRLLPDDGTLDHAGRLAEFADVRGIDHAGDPQGLNDAVARAALQMNSGADAAQGAAGDEQHLGITPDQATAAFTALLKEMVTETGRDAKFGGFFPQGINFISVQFGVEKGITVTVSSQPAPKT